MKSKRNFKLNLELIWINPFRPKEDSGFQFVPLTWLHLAWENWVRIFHAGVTVAFNTDSGCASTPSQHTQSTICPVDLSTLPSTPLSICLSVPLGIKGRFIQQFGCPLDLQPGISKELVRVVRNAQHLRDMDISPTDVTSLHTSDNREGKTKWALKAQVHYLQKSSS